MPAATQPARASPSSKPVAGAPARRITAGGRSVAACRPPRDLPGAPHPARGANDGREPRRDSDSTRGHARHDMSYSTMHLKTCPVPACPDHSPAYGRHRHRRAEEHARQVAAGWRPSARRRFGSAARRACIPTRTSRRPRPAPRQLWTPQPNPRWRAGFGRVRSKRSGPGNARGRSWPRRRTSSPSRRRISTPPTDVARVAWRGSICTEQCACGVALRGRLQQRRRPRRCAATARAAPAARTAASPSGWPTSRSRRTAAPPGARSSPRWSTRPRPARAEQRRDQVVGRLGAALRDELGVVLRA